MKKIISGTIAAAAMLFTSCSQDEMPVGNGDLATVNVSVHNATAISSRAFGKGEEATTLQFAVYDLTGETPTLLKTLYDNGVKTDDEFNGHGTYPLQLATGRTYGFVFWAANASAPYDVDFGDNSAVMTADYNNAMANAEILDAFFAYETITVSGPQTLQVGLKRPFTQINFGTSDMEASAAAGYTPTQTKVVVSGVYSTLNLMTKEVVGNTTDFEFGYADIPSSEEKFPDVKTGSAYRYLAMTYVLVPEDQILVTTDLYHTDGASEYTLNVSNVPVQRNYRTNIFGALLTDELSVEVNTEPDFDGDNDEEQVAVPAGQAVMDGKTYLSLKDAIAAAEGAEATIYIAGKDYIASEELVFPAGNNTKYTIVGGQSAGSRAEGETSITIDKGIYLTHCPDLTFEKIKIINKTGTAYTEQAGAQLNYVTNLTVKNCEIEHCLRFLATGKVVFKGCHFVNNVKSGFDGYSLHYYSGTDSEVLVEDCTFDVVSKAIVLYSEGNFKYDLTVNNCKFTASTKDDKSAIQMHTDGNTNYGTVRINNTTATNFDDTRNGGLWYEENNTTHVVTYRFDVFVDGELVHTSDKIDVDGNPFNTLKDAVEAAKNGSTIKLGCGNYDSKTVTWPSNMELTFTGINPKLSHLSNLSYFTAEGSTFHFKDLTLDVEIGGSATSMGFKEVAGATYDNVVFNGQYCLFAGTHTIENSVFNYVPESEASNNYGGGTRYCLYGQPEGKTTVKKCVFNNISSRAFLVYNFGSDKDIIAGDIEMSDCEFNATGDKTRGVLEIHSEKYNGAGTITLTNIQWSQDAYKGLWNEINGGPYYTIIVDGTPEQTPEK